jgi:hypothetical protein
MVDEGLVSEGEYVRSQYARMPRYPPLGGTVENGLLLTVEKFLSSRQPLNAEVDIPF